MKLFSLSHEAAWDKNDGRIIKVQPANANLAEKWLLKKGICKTDENDQLYFASDVVLCRL